MLNLRFVWVVTSATMHLKLTARFFFFQLALFTDYRNAHFVQPGPAVFFYNQSLYSIFPAPSILMLQLSDYCAMMQITYENPR